MVQLPATAAIEYVAACCITTPCPGKKRTNSILGITSSNTDRFTNFFHFYNLLEICNKALVKYYYYYYYCKILVSEN